MSKTKIVAILNVTPDSFSDGGKNYSFENAIISAQKMIDAEVDVIDIGSESTRPGAAILDHQTEWLRLEPILRELVILTSGTRTKLSIDSYHYDTIKKALSMGVNWINDVSSCVDPRIIALAAEYKSKIVLMHGLGIPVQQNIVLGDDYLDVIKQWAEDKIQELLAANISYEQIIFDPGIGFGKTKEQSFGLIKSIKIFNDLHVKLLVGHSRKSFMSMFSDAKPSERDLETHIISSYLARNDIDYIRVHDFIGNKRAIKLTAS